MKVGSVTLDSKLGGYELLNIPVSTTKLPQEVASAMVAINTNYLGATFVPLWYVGKQVVNGANYLFIAKEVRSTKERNTAIVGLVANVPAGAGFIHGKGANIVEIIEEVDLPEEAKEAFENGTKQLMGMNYKPIVYVGSQVVKGMNYYYICEAKGVYPDAKPFAVMLGVNVFQDQATVFSVTPLAALNKSEDQLCGYAFTW